MSRKAYFFLIDAIFAVVILVIGFMLVSSHKVDQHQVIGATSVSESYMELLSSVKIDELCDGCGCSNPKLSQYCLLTNNTGQSLLDFMGELYVKDEKIKLRELFENITKKTIRTDLYGLELRIEGERIYPSSDDPSRVRSPQLITNKKMIFGFIEQPDTGEVSFWGPYILEVDVWEK